MEHSDKKKCVHHPPLGSLFSDGSRLFPGDSRRISTNLSSYRLRFSLSFCVGDGLVFDWLPRYCTSALSVGVRTRSVWVDRICPRARRSWSDGHVATIHQSSHPKGGDLLWDAASAISPVGWREANPFVRIFARDKRCHDSSASRLATDDGKRVCGGSSAWSAEGTRDQAKPGAPRHSAVSARERSACFSPVYSPCPYIEMYPQSIHQSLFRR